MKIENTLATLIAACCTLASIATGCSNVVVNVSSNTKTIATHNFPSLQVSNQTCKWSFPDPGPNKSIFLRVVNFTSSSHSVNMRIFERFQNVFVASRSAHDIRIVLNGGGNIEIALNYNNKFYFLFKLEFRKVDRCGFTRNFTTPISITSYSIPGRIRDICGWSIFRVGNLTTTRSMAFIVNITNFKQGTGVLQVYGYRSLLANVQTNSIFYNEKLLRLFYDSGSNLPQTNFSAGFSNYFCIHTLTSTPAENIITPPGYPHAHFPYKFQCNWTIERGNFKKGIYIRIEYFDYSEKLTLFDGTKVIGDYTRQFYQRKPIELVIHSKYAVLQFVTSSGKRGFRVIYQEVAGCGFVTSSQGGDIITPNFPRKVPPRSYCGWSIFRLKPQKNEIFGLNLNLTSHLLNSNTLQVYGFDQAKQTLETNITEFGISGSNLLRIFYKTGNTSGPSFVGKYQTEVCGGTLMASKETKTFFSGKYEFSINRHSSCSWRFNCTLGKSLFIHYNGGRLPQNTNSHNQRVISSQSKANYVVHNIPFKLAYQTAYINFKLNYSEVETCGFTKTGIFNESFTYPHISKNRPPLKVCAWNFYPSSGFVGRLEITMLQQLELGQILQVSCGQHVVSYKNNWTQSQCFANNIKLFYQANQLNSQNPVFMVTYNMSQVCQKSYFANTTFQYIDFFASKPITFASIYCRWSIQNFGNKSLLFNLVYLESFSISPLKFSAGYLQGYFGNGTKNINFVLNTQNVNFILNEQNSKHRPFGFILKFKNVNTCGDNQRGASGNITSPLYDPSWKEMNCGWNIGYTGSNILLNITSLHIAPGDKFEVYDDLRLLNTGITSNSTIFYTALMLRIFFYSNGQSNFSLTYERTKALQNCGPRTLNATSEEKFLISPGYPFTYSLGRTCDWAIASSSNTEMIVLKLTSFDIKPGATLLVAGNGINERFFGKNDIFISNSSVRLTFFVYSRARTIGRGFKLSYKKVNCPSNLKCHSQASCNLNKRGEWTCRCNQGFVGDGFQCLLSCPKEVLQNEGKNFTFQPSTLWESPTSIETCSNGNSIASAVCTRISSSTGKLKNLTILQCSENIVTVATLNKLQVNGTTESVAKTVSKLKLLMTGNSTVAFNDSNVVSEYLVNVTKIPPSQIKISVGTMYNTLFITDKISSSVKENQKLNLIHVLENFTDRIVMPENQTVLNLFTRGIDLQVHIISKKFRKTIGRTTDKQSSYYFDNVTFQTRKTTMKDSPIATVPGILLDEVSKQHQIDDVQVSFTLHKTKSLFPSSDGDLSQVLSVHVKSPKKIDVKQPISLIFKNVNVTQGAVPLQENPLKENVTRTQCVELNRKFYWSSNNCLRISTKITDLEFQYYEFGHFAMIIKSTVLPSAHALHLATIVGCSLSMAGLVATFIIYCSVQALRTRKPTMFLINICICLFLSNLIFLIGNENIKKRIECYVTTALLHFFLLASWCWMSASAYDLYRALVKVIQNPSQKFRAASCVMCYLLPLAVVLINTGVTIFNDDIKRYRNDDNLFQSSYRARHICWLHLYSLNYGFLLPVGILAFFNFCLFVLVFSSLTCCKTKIRSTAQKRSRVQDFVLAITLVLIMGLTWVFGFLMLIADDVIYLTVMAWLFTIINSLQGFFIFISNCIRNPSVRSLWLQPIANAFHCGKSQITDSTAESRASGVKSKTNSAPSTSQL